MDSLGQSDYKSDYKDGTMLTPTNMSFDRSLLEYTIRSPIDVLRKQIDEVQEEDLKQKNRIQQLEKELKKLGDKDSEYQKELKKLKDRELERMREIAILTSTKSSLQSENSELKSDLNKCESEKMSVYQDYQRLKREDDKRSKEFDGLSKKTRDLEKQVKEHQKDNSTLLTQNKLLNDDLQLKHEQLIKWEENCKKLEIERQTEDAKHQNELNLLNGKLDEKSSEVEDLSSTLKKLEDRVQKLQHEKSYTDSMAQSYRNEIAQLKRSRDELEEQKRAEFGKYVKQINDLNDKLKRLNQDNKQLKEANDKCSREIEEFKEDLKYANGTIVELKDQLSQREKEYKENENQLKTDLNSFRNQLNDAHSKNEKLKESLSSLNGLINRVNDNYNADKEQLGKLQQDNHLLKSELNEKSSSLNELREECDQLKVKLSKLNEEKILLAGKVKDVNSLAIRYNELFKEHFRLNPDKCHGWCFDSRFTSAKLFSAEFIENKFNELQNDCQKKIQIELNKLKKLTDEYEERLLEKENQIKELNEEKLSLGTEKDSSDREKSKLEKKVDMLVEENYDLIKKVQERSDEILALTSDFNKLNEEKRKLDEELARLQSSAQRETNDLDGRAKRSHRETQKDSIARSGVIPDSSGNRSKSIEKSKKLQYALDQNSNFLKSIDDETSKFNSLEVDENKNSLNLNANKYHRSPLSAKKTDDYQFSLADVERQKLREAQQKAEELLKKQGYYSKKNGKSGSEKPEVCFDLKDTEDSSLESSNFKSGNNLEKYISFKEHLNFNDLERRTKKGLPATSSVSDKQQPSTIRELDEETVTSGDLPTGAASRLKVQLTDFYKKPANKFTSNKDVHFTSTPINKNTKIKKLNYEY